MVDQHAVKQNEEIREIGKGQIMQGFVDHSKKFGFFFFLSKRCREIIERKLYSYLQKIALAVLWRTDCRRCGWNRAGQ